MIAKLFSFLAFVLMSCVSTAQSHFNTLFGDSNTFVNIYEGLWTADDHYVLTGIQGGDVYNSFLIKLNHGGDTIWSTFDADTVDNISYAAVELPGNNGFMACGTRRVYFDSEKYTGFILKTDTAGNIEWIKSYYPDTFVNFRFLDIISSDSNSVIVAGNYNDSERHVTVSKIDFAGQVIWTRTPDFDFALIAPVLLFRLNENEFLVGSNIDNGDTNPLLMKFDMQGNIIWARQFTLGGQNEFAFINNIDTTADQHLILTLESYNYTNSWRTIIYHKTDMSGVSVWSRNPPFESAITRVYSMPGNKFIALEGSITGQDGIFKFTHLDSLCFPLSTTVDTSDLIGTPSHGLIKTSSAPVAYYSAGHLIGGDSLGNSLCSQTPAIPITVNTVLTLVSNPVVVSLNPVTLNDTSFVIFESHGIHMTDYCSQVMFADEYVKGNDLLIYPNPATRNFTIRNAQNKVSLLQIFNSIGQEIQSIDQSSDENGISVNCDQLKSGIYFVKLVMDDDRRSVVVVKLMIE